MMINMTTLTWFGFLGNHLDSHTFVTGMSDVTSR
jgi:hypothetical protein